MKKILQIFNTHKYAIIWTICYIAIVWAILNFMFNFSIFNTAQWHKLAHAELHGFAGFVFGLLILAMLPLYIATTTLIIRTKKPLVTIPIPKIKPINLVKKNQNTTPIKTPEEVTTPKTEEKQQETLPDELPPELHSAFIRARNRISAYEQITPCSSANITEIDEQPGNGFPLPTDFDVQLNTIPGINSTPNFSTPVFTDIQFDTTPLPPSSTLENSDNKQITEYLTKQNIPFRITDDIITTDTYAIITHNDSDFWVIDTDNWFANGKTRPSPINQIQQFATEHNLIPVIYLESTNIMDIDTHIKQWESNNIIVITSPDELYT